MGSTILKNAAVRWSAALFLAVTAAGIAGTAHATFMVPLSLKRLTRRSQMVVEGRVTARQSFWNRSRRRILTRITIRVRRSLKGRKQAGSTVTVQRLGGRIGRIVMRVLGAPRFRPGEDVVVFLNRRRRTLYVTGMAQGKFTVKRHATTGVQAVTRNLNGIRWTSRRVKPSGRMTLNALRAAVKAARKKKGR